MRWYKVDEKSSGVIGSTPSEPPPEPPPPPGTLSGIFLFLADWLLRLRDSFWELGDFTESAPIIGDWLAYPFNAIGDIFDGFQRGVRSWAETAGDIDFKLANLLTWEGISDKIKSIFFGDKSVSDYIWDEITDFVDEHIKPTLDSLWDKATEIYNYIDDSIDKLEIPDWSSLSGGAEEWLREQLYKLLPWGDLPDLSMSEEAAAWLGKSIDGIPWLADIKSWYDSVVSDARDFLDDPQGWLSRNLEGAFSGMLALASWPLLRAIEAFINRMWDEKE